tara:strand:- start:126 stop:323 length:198 start_codon:yes stop_codon:yes gene_type:complete
VIGRGQGIGSIGWIHDIGILMTLAALAPREHRPPDQEDEQRQSAHSFQHNQRHGLGFRVGCDAAF